VRLLHALAKTVASFDDPHLVSHAGLVAGMAAGAGSIDDMDVLRHGAMGTLFGGIRAPSTLGSHLRSCTWGNVSQLEKAGREFLAELARRAPLLPGARTLAFTDIDSMQKRVHGHARQGAKFGHAKIQGKSLLVRGLNALAAVISTPIAAPVIGATRLRGGNAGSPFELVQAETRHRGHAVVEQVFADVTSGPLAHLPLIIFSPTILRPSELWFCVVDSVVHGTSSGSSEGRPGSFCSPFPGRVVAGERIVAARCSPSARSSASRSWRFSVSRRRMREVAASSRRSSEAGVARCRSGTGGDAGACCCRARSRSTCSRRSSWA